MQQAINAGSDPEETSVGSGRPSLTIHEAHPAGDRSRHLRQSSSKQVCRTYLQFTGDMLQPKSAKRILLAVTLCSSSAIDAYGFPAASFLHPSIQQKELTMSFVVWVALGLAAGFIGGRLADRSGESVMPDVLLGVVGAVTGGWLFYAFGPPGVNGFHLQSHLAAVFGSLVFLLTYYVLRPV